MNKKRCFKMFLVALAVMWGISWNSMSANAATEAQKSEFVAELEEMLYSADTSTHYVYNYKLTTSEFNKLYDNMKNGDCRLIIASYYSNMRVTYKTKWFWIESIQITNVDSDVLPRYERLKNNVVAIQSGIEEDMTDLDKIIYLHDALVDLTSYKYVAYQSYGACGALGDKLAVCAGYTKAYNMLLNMNGIEAYYAEGDGIDHGWTYVKLDGEWYHVDTTWDDVQGGPSHQYLLRNDKEFVTVGAKSHVAWTLDDVSESSTSTRFSDWYVHDIKGKMSFEDGLWYYVDVNNDIVCADAWGNASTLVLDGANLATLTLVDVEDGMITYKVGGNTKCELLTNVGEDVIVEVPEENVASGDNIESDNAASDNKVSVEGNSSVLDYDFNDINNWQEGQYSTSNGAFTDGAGYICTKELVVCGGQVTLDVVMKDTRFHGVVNEYTEDGSFIRSTDVVNGDRIITDAACGYLGVSIYFPGWKTIAFEEYTTKFTYDLMSFELQMLEENNVETEENIPEDNTQNSVGVIVECMGNIEAVDFNNIAIWQEGGYDAETGEMTALEGYICTQKLVAVNDKVPYLITMKDTRFHTVINEYAEDGSFIISTDLVEGNTWTPQGQTAYVGVSIYFPMWKSIPFSEYKTKFTYNLMSLEISKVQ